MITFAASLRACRSAAELAQAALAERSGIEAPAVGSPSAGRASQGVKAFVEGAVEAAAEADRLIAEIQDSAIALESGDAELRKGLSETRGPERMAEISRKGVEARLRKAAERAAARAEALTLENRAE